MSPELPLRPQVSAGIGAPCFPTYSQCKRVKKQQAQSSQRLPFISYLSSQSATLPAGFRQKDQTQKAATGPFDREHLLMYLEKEALEQKDREDFVPFTGEKKGKVRRLHVLGQNGLHTLWHFSQRS